MFLAAQVDIIAGNPRIWGGDLPETYNLAQFHFHWGSTNNFGSEHTLRNQRYPMEVFTVYSCLHSNGLVRLNHEMRFSSAIAASSRALGKQPR